MCTTEQSRVRVTLSPLILILGIFFIVGTSFPHSFTFSSSSSFFLTPDYARSLSVTMYCYNVPHVIIRNTMFTTFTAEREVMEKAKHGCAFLLRHQLIQPDIFPSHFASLFLYQDFMRRGIFVPFLLFLCAFYFILNSRFIPWK